MKKKIKDLNQNELDKICFAHSCSNCPICILDRSNCHCLVPLILDKNKVKKIMETEIEIEVEE